MMPDDQETSEAETEASRGSRLETWITVAIAAVSLATAVAAWRTTDLGSQAGDAERQGLIESVQEQSLANEDWRLVYEGAGNAKRYFVAEAEAEALAASGDEVGRAQAEALRQYLLPSLALLATALFLFGLAQAASGRIRMPFSIIGGAVAGLALVWTVSVLMN